MHIQKICIHFQQDSKRTLHGKLSHIHRQTCREVDNRVSFKVAARDVSASSQQTFYHQSVASDNGVRQCCQTLGVLSVNE